MLLPLAGRARGCTGEVQAKTLAKSISSNHKSYPVQTPYPHRSILPSLELTLKESTGQRSTTTSTAAPTAVTGSLVPGSKYVLHGAAWRHRNQILQQCKRRPAASSHAALHWAVTLHGLSKGRAAAARARGGPGFTLCHKPPSRYQRAPDEVATARARTGAPVPLQ